MNRQFNRWALALAVAAALAGPAQAQADVTGAHQIHLSTGVPAPKQHFSPGGRSLSRRLHQPVELAVPHRLEPQRHRPLLHGGGVKRERMLGVLTIPGSLRSVHACWRRHDYGAAILTGSLR